MEGQTTFPDSGSPETSICVNRKSLLATTAFVITNRYEGVLWAIHYLTDVVFCCRGLMVQVCHVTRYDHCKVCTESAGSSTSRELEPSTS